MGSKMEDLMKNLNKEFKEDILHKGLANFDYQRIPFTSPRLNYMTYGGLPMGKLIEFYGEEHGGKTTTALDIVANYQLMDDAKGVVWADLENTLDTVWATKLGVNVDDMWILNPTNQGAEKTYGGIAMALTNFSKKAEMLCHRHNCTIIGINQMRDDLNSAYGGTTTTGGKAWKHNCSVRLEFRMGKYFDESGKDLSRGTENPAGNYVLVSMKKNKTCRPDRRVGEYRLTYLNGIDYISDLIDVAVKYGIVEKSGAWFQIVDIETGEMLGDKLQGQANLSSFLADENNADILQRVEKLIDAKIYD